MLTIDNFFNQHRCGDDWKSHRDYAYRLSGSYEPGMELIKCGFILWNEDEAHIWAGPWCGIGVFFKICDYSKVKWIQTCEERDASLKRRALYGYYTFPYKSRKLLDNLRVSKNPDELTSVERSMLLSVISEEEYMEYFSNYGKVYDNLLKEFSVTVEHPIKLYLCGNDDTSYSASFARPDLAIDALKEIDANPTMKTLNKFDFKFTN